MVLGRTEKTTSFPLLQPRKRNTGRELASALKGDRINRAGFNPGWACVWCIQKHFGAAWTRSADVDLKMDARLPLHRESGQVAIEGYWQAGQCCLQVEVPVLKSGGGGLDVPRYRPQWTATSILPEVGLRRIRIRG